MAASDKPFNNQHVLDIVYAVSNILLLGSVVWMLVQDYNREYKTELRALRDVEVTLSQWLAVASLPDAKEFDEKEKAVNDTRLSDAQKDEVKEARRELARLQPLKEKAEAAYQTASTEYGSKLTFRSIALEHAKTPEETKRATEYWDKVLAGLLAESDKTQAERDAIVSEMKVQQMKIERLEAPHTKALAEFKKVNDKIDGQVKLALSKRWGFGDWFRSLWVIDGFASPLKIHQIVVNDVTIDYNFKKVPRIDRCMSCHATIADPRFSRENLARLTQDNPHEDKLKAARDFYDRRVKALGDNRAEIDQIPNPYDIRLNKLSDKLLTPGRITEFAAHPRLDLFVGSDSKHSAERFGCTACHSGQGSGTSFNDASHTPNSMAALSAWSKDRRWEFNHMWDFPMHSTRFVESSCLKCHHEVTDLVSSDNRVEAPKLFRGFNLIKENGCFGCHEISGWKSGERIGPDLRLEPNPPLEELNEINPHLYNRAKNDTDNRPGNLRKVGPSLARVHEKLQTAWIEKWLASPSAFRPDTKMPHYYGLSNNLESELPGDQKRFPNTEMASIAHFLTVTSKDYVAEAGKVKSDAATIKAEKERIDVLVARGRLEDKEQKELDTLKRNARLRKVTPLEDLTPKDYKANKDNGRILFTERGCLACHTHQATETAQGNAGKPETYAPEIKSDAVFGPNLSQVAEKLGDSDAARKWLVQWIMNPQLHSPRSRMPVTHLTGAEAADIAAWLLAQPYARDANDPWKSIKVDPPTKEELHDLARVYLTRMVSKKDMERFLKGELKGVDWEVVEKDVTVDERRLKDKVNDENELKYYLGKKAVTRLGCFACHDIPGMENVKSIGVALNDWGKKPADRLAFEDIHNFFDKHYYPTDKLTDDNGKPLGIKDGKEPYEAFYANALIGHHHQREGYLNQKIRDPRSYDFNRVRAWDDRSRMPKFTFARPRKQKDEDDAAFKARAMYDEAAAREAVATFILGLTAEQVPAKSINTPTGDREKEVKGRQVLDKYNCAGCHTIRPGVYDFKLSTKSFDQLMQVHAGEQVNIDKTGEILHNNHINWMGRNPLGLDRSTTYASQANYEEGEVNLRLNEALRFINKDKKILSIPAGARVNLPIEDLGGDPAKLKTQDDFDRAFPTVAPYGGTYTDLMVPWLMKKDKAKYADARANLPPTLVNQGERTQADWLYNFLLNPTPIRKMSILRMPKFNLSSDEAAALRDYFAAVTKQVNPGIGLSYPNEVIPSRDDLKGAYWRQKTANYIAYLRATDEKDKDGKVLGKLFDSRVKAYTKVWEQIRDDNTETLNKSIKRIGDDLTKAKSDRAALQAKAEGEKDPKTQASLQEDVKNLDALITSLDDQKTQSQAALKALDVAKQREQWEKEDAYAADAYRLVLSRQLCTKCHQVGDVKAADQGVLAKTGPPLDLAGARLRPDFVERWVNKPQRFVPYSSVMPPYFNKDKLEHQDIFAGPADAQLHAVRDVLMNYRRLSLLPINQAYNPDRK